MESNKRHITDQDYEDIIEILEQMRSSNDSGLYRNLLLIFGSVEELTLELIPPLRFRFRYKSEIVERMIEAAKNHQPRMLVKLIHDLI
jgi:hypothetical protein